MEQANPEVKLALAVERATRRGAGPLRAALAAAERVVQCAGEPDALLAGPEPLRVLAALLEDPAAATARDPLRLRRRTQAPAQAATPDRPRLRSVGGNDARAAVARSSGTGGPRASAVEHRPEPDRGPLQPLNTATADGRSFEPSLYPTVAHRRAALRQAVAAAPSVTPSDPVPPPARSFGPVPIGGAAPDRPVADPAPTSPPGEPHALVALAARGAGGAARVPAWSGEIAGMTSPQGTEAAVQISAKRRNPTATPPAAAAAVPPVALVPPPAGEPSRAGVDTATATAAAPIAGARPRPPPLTLTDDSLAEAAWRNGVDLSWP